VKTSHAVLMAALLTSFAFLPAAHAGVIVVDPLGGPGGGALLQSAIDTAQPGDIILLRAGDYTDLEISVPGKPLSIVADAGGAQITLRRLRVFPASTESTTLVRGVRAEPPPALASSGPGAGITIGGGFFPPGATWLEDSTAFANPVDIDGPGGFPGNSQAGISVIFSQRVVIVRCEATGSAGLDAAEATATTSTGGAGLELFASGAIHECTFTGGAGGDGSVPFLANGGSGADLGFGLSAFMDCTLQGGDEGDGNGASVQPGAGLVIGGSAFPSLRGVVATAGAVVGSGTPVADIVNPANATIFPAAPRGLQVPAPLREGEASALSVHGVQGDAVFVQASTGASHFNVPSKQGAYVLASALPAPLFLGGITDPSGTLVVPIHVPALPAGLDGQVIFLQSFMAPTEGGVVLGSGSAFVWIDATL
jgi:hypothetical protein